MESRRENGSPRPTEGHFGPGGGRSEWSGGLPAPTHDPNEVTVQIDGVGRCLAGESGGSTAGGTRVMQGFSDTQSVADTPVFVDETGRRSRRYRRIGAAVGLLCAGYAVVMAATLVSGNSSAPWLPVPDPKDEQPASQVDTPELPTEPAAGPTAPATGGAAPKSPSASASTPPSTSTDARSGGGGVPGAGGEPGRSIPSARGDDAAGGSEGSSGSRPAREGGGSGGKSGSRPGGGGSATGAPAPGGDATAPGADPDGPGPAPTEESGPPVAPPTGTPDGGGSGSGGAEGGGDAGAGAGGEAGAGVRAVADGRVQGDGAAGGVRA